MVSALVMFIVLAVLQVGFSLHVRNTLILAASEGARAAARLDASLDRGPARAHEVVTGALSDSFAQEISVGTEWVGGIEVVVVTISAPIPIVGPLGPGQSLTVSGRAFREAQ